MSEETLLQCKIIHHPPGSHLHQEIKGLKLLHTNLKQFNLLGILYINQRTLEF